MTWFPGDCFNIKMCLTSIGIPMLKIRWSCDHLIFNMGIPTPGKDGLYIEAGPRFLTFLIFLISADNGWFSQSVSTVTRQTINWIQNWCHQAAEYKVKTWGYYHIQNEKSSVCSLDMCTIWHIQRQNYNSMMKLYLMIQIYIFTSKCWWL